MGSAKVHYSGTSIFILLLVGIVLLGIKTTYAAPYPAISYPRYYSSEAFAGQDPEYLIQTIAKLRQALINDGDIENSKRGLDFGLGRGFSGSQTAKHLMGLAAANFAGGSGRRRRGDTDV